MTSIHCCDPRSSGVLPFLGVSFSPSKIKTLGNSVAFAPIPFPFVGKAASGFSFGPCMPLASTLLQLGNWVGHLGCV